MEKITLDVSWGKGQAEKHGVVDGHVSRHVIAVPSDPVEAYNALLKWVSVGGLCVAFRQTATPTEGDLTLLELANRRGQRRGGGVSAKALANAESQGKAKGILSAFASGYIPLKKAALALYDLGFASADIRAIEASADGALLTELDRLIETE